MTINEMKNYNMRLNILIFLWGKAFEKQIKTIEGQAQKQVEALKHLKQKNKQKQLKINQVMKIINQ